VRSGQLGGDGGALGPLGRTVERARARARPAARSRRGPGPQVEHAERRGGNDGAAGLVVRRARAGGGVRAGVGVIVALLIAGPAVRLPAQTDTLRAVALRVAQTRPDSGRAMMRRLLASLSPRDSLYPGALFTAGMLAPDAGPRAPDRPPVVGRRGRGVSEPGVLLRSTVRRAAGGRYTRDGRRQPGEARGARDDLRRASPRRQERVASRPNAHPPQGYGLRRPRGAGHERSFQGP